MKLKANAERSGSWWVITVPEVPGLFTQVKHLNEVEDMVLDALAVLQPDKKEQPEIEVKPIVDNEEVEEVKRLQLERQLLAKKATSKSAAVVKKLKNDGLTVRDIALILGCSAQTVSNLSKVSVS
jgi:predicted RNase H-like HicB family nuclease